MGTTGETHTRAIKLCIDMRALTSEQRAVLARSVGTARKAWNWALADANRQFAARRDYVADLARRQAGSDDGVRELLADPGWRKRAYQAAVREHGTYSAAAASRRFTAAIRDPDDPEWSWWATEAHGVNRFAVSTALRDLGEAMARYSTRSNVHTARKPRKDGKPAGYPRFKKKGRCRDSFGLFNITAGGARPTDTQRWRPIDGAHRVRLPSLGGVRVHENTRRLRRLIARGGTIKGAHISRRADRWYVALTVQMPGAEPAPTPTRRQRAAGTVGIDMGVHTLAALSTGETITNPRWARAEDRRLSRQQRAAARRYRKGSRDQSTRHRKAIAAAARTQRRIAEHRAGHLHAISKRITTSWATVGIEDLNVSGMLAAPAPAPDPERDGHFLPNGKASKSGLARSISDAGFYELRRQLTYKTRWYGSRIFAVDRYAPTSKTCSSCGTVKPTLSLGERTYQCGVCGHSQDRDVNAAINIARLAARNGSGHVAPGRGKTQNGRDNQQPPPYVAVNAGPVRPDPPPGGSARPARDRLSTPPHQKRPHAV